MADLTVAEGRRRTTRSGGGVGALPNFLIIGAAKCGTTSLHYYLQQHPEIFMCPRKDTFFFDFGGHEPNYAGPGDEEWYTDFAVVHLEEYEALFAGVSSEKAVGEACAGYLYAPQASECVHRHIPHAKLIAVLRDPAERAYSSFLHEVRDGHETAADFAEGLALEKDRIRDNWRPIWHYRARGFYYEQIQRYLSLFGSSQLRIYLYEDLKENPTAMLKDIFSFLEVDESFVPDTSRKHNVAGFPRSRTLFKLVMTPNLLKTLIRPLLPAGFRNSLRSAITESRTSLHRPPLPPELRKRLVDEYRPDILKLQDLIRRDLSHWLL